MNKARRKEITKLSGIATGLVDEYNMLEPEEQTIEKRKEIAGKFADLKSQIEEVRSSEEEYFENLSEKAQEGENGDIAQNAISALESAADECDTVVNVLENENEDDEELIVIECDEVVSYLDDAAS